MTFVGALLTQLLHLALMLAAAPLVVGATCWLKARLMGRRGAPPLQPFRDLEKLLRKRPVLAENASWVSELAPYAGVAAPLAAAALVPSFARGMVLSPVGDLVVVAGLLTLARMALALAGMDVGTAFGGLGAAREMKPVGVLSRSSRVRPAFGSAVTATTCAPGAAGFSAAS